MIPARQSRLRTVVVSAIWVCAVAVPPAAYAQQQDDAFKEGLEARDDRKWQEAAAAMRRAIQIDPKETGRKIRRGLGGMLGGGTEYLPHYFLGEALYNLGDCVGAVEAWDVSEQQGVVASRSESVAFLRKGYAECERKGVLPPAKYAPLLSRARQQLSETTTMAASVSASAQAHLGLWRLEMKEQYDRASVDLQQAQSRLTIATRTRSERDFSDATTAMERARTALRALESQLNAAVALHGTVQGIVTEIEQALANADASDKVLEGKRALIPSSLAAARKAAQDALARARSELTSGVRASNVAALAEARATAHDAATKFKQVLDDVMKIETRTQERRAAEALAHAQEAFSFVDGGFTTLDRLSAEKAASVRPELAEERALLEKHMIAARRRFAAAQRARDIEGLQDAARRAGDVRARLDALIGSFGPVTIVDRGVRPALAEGARLFFAGEYQQALAALDLATLTGVPLQAHVHLFRAAALFALYVRSGETDHSLRAQALAEIDTISAANPEFVPDARWFAPRFVKFFQNATAAPREPAPSAPSGS